MDALDTFLLVLIQLHFICVAHAHLVLFSVGALVPIPCEALRRAWALFLTFSVSSLLSESDQINSLLKRVDQFPKMWFSDSDGERKRNNEVDWASLAAVPWLSPLASRVSRRKNPSALSTSLITRQLQNNA